MDYLFKASIIFHVLFSKVNITYRRRDSDSYTETRYLDFQALQAGETVLLMYIGSCHLLLTLERNWVKRWILNCILILMNNTQHVLIYPFSFDLN